MRKIIHCQRRLSKGSLSKLQMAGLLQEAAGPLAACPQKLPMAGCDNSGPPQKFYPETISAVRDKPVLFSGPEMVARPIALSGTTHHAIDAVFSARAYAGVPCALDCS